MTRAGPTTSLTLVERIRQFDGTAWQTFVEIYYPLVYGWCRRAGLQEHDAADVVQEVFRAVSGDIVEFRRSRPEDSLRGWLRGITRHKLQDFWRARQQRELAAGGTAALEVLSAMPWKDDRDANTESEELQAIVQRALTWIRGEVHEQTWQAAMRVFIQGESVAEVAQRLELSPNAVYKAKTRVLRRLREVLTEWDIINGSSDPIAEAEDP